MSLTLVVLAAGMGSRYGGLKQLDAVGPSGETMLGYAVFDAARAGFDRVVFVIRRDFEREFQEQIVRRYIDVIEVTTVFQAMDDLPGGVRPPAERTKPWGTGHALWCARAAVRGPFAVINADDFYGRDSYVQLARFLNAPVAGPVPRFALVGFRLDQTLSENGSVSRGVCTVQPEPATGALRLQHVEERTGIARSDVGPGRIYSGAETVSMNCWGLTPAVFPMLERRLSAFISGHASDPKAEFYLPAAVSAMIGDGEAEVHVLPTASRWFGVTYREDRPAVAAAILQWVAEGEYPHALRRAAPVSSSP